MIKKETKIKFIDTLEKLASNVKNADKTTLWTVIVLLSLAIFINKTTPPTQVVINIPANTTGSIIVDPATQTFTQNK